MNRKVGALVAAVLVAALAIWFFAFRDRSSSKPQPKAGRNGKIELPKSTPAKTDDTPAPQGMAPRWSLDVDPEGPLRLEGQVVDEDGHGVGGAEVWLGSVPPRSAKSEDDGTFAFDKLVGREYGLTATAGERVGGPVQYKLTESSDPVVIRLTKSAKVVVTVLADDSKPIEGADVRLAAMGERTAKTAADGTATLSPVAPGWVAVQATANGYAPGNGFTQVGSAGAVGTIKVTLHKGVPVTGRVVDEAGAPIAKAHMSTAGIWDLPSATGCATCNQVVTDTNGEFTFPALGAGTHVLVATDGEHAPARSAPVTVADQPVKNVKITMKAGGTLAGTVVDDQQKPVPFATVRVGGDGQQMWMVDARQATSDRTGHFELKGLARAKLKARAESDIAASAIATLDLTSTPKAELKLVLDVKGTIAGVVVNETNEPVAEVQVNAFPDIFGGNSPESISLAGFSSATTDGAGHFVIRGLPDGGYRLRAARSTGGRYDWGQQGTPAKVGDKNVKITLAAEGSIVGKLVVEGGGAPKLATVQVGSQPSTPASADGTFKLEDVAPGKYDLHVRGHDFAEFIQHDVEVKPGKPTDVGTLTLMRGRKLVGKVIDAGGNPVPGTKVKTGDMLFSMQGGDDQMENLEEMYGARTDITDQDGKFTLIGIAKKSTSVIADHPTRGRSVAVSLPAGTDDPPPVTLTLKGYGSITGKVTSKGEPVGGATITDTPKGGGAQIRIVQSEADGTFTLTKIGEGTHVVSAMQQSMLGMSLKSTSTTVQVREGKESKVAIDIPVGSLVLAVQVKAQAGQKVDSAQIFLFRGAIVVHNAKELTEGFLSGGVQGMKFWLGEGKPVPEFDELVAGDYSVCTIPITGDLNDSQFQARIQEHMDVLKVYCKKVPLAASPQKQTFIAEVPAMTPLPQN
ncbi:MAG TPA: carboxypeptidase regulatory-like domain-containing protein [Kofleriaceae bacterium]|nr:carboxypeptidase regulatory-like domain-containing protein [Kofleriaceae bacterium]